MDNTPAKVAFATAAMDLAMICAKVEDLQQWEILHDELTECFTAALTNVVAAVDRRKALLRENEARLQAAIAYHKDLGSYIKRLERIKESVIESTKQVVAMHPDVTFHDSMGIPLTVRKNAPKVVIEESKLDDASAAFTHTKTTKHLDLAMVKEFLVSGHELPWARLECGTQLRGLK